MIWGQWVLRWEGWGGTNQTWRMWKTLNGDWDIGTVLKWDWMWRKWGSGDVTRARGWRSWIWKDYVILEMGGLEQPWRCEFVWEETGKIQPRSADKQQQEGEGRPRDTSWPDEAQGTRVWNWITAPWPLEGWGTLHLPPQYLPVVRDESKDWAQEPR